MCTRKHTHIIYLSLLQLYWSTVAFLRTSDACPLTSLNVRSAKHDLANNSSL